MGEYESQPGDLEGQPRGLQGQLEGLEGQPWVLGGQPGDTGLPCREALGRPGSGLRRQLGGGQPGVGEVRQWAGKLTRG